MRAYFSATPRFGILVPWWISLPLLFLWCAAALAFWLFYSMGMMVVIIVGAGQETWTWWRERRAQRDGERTPAGHDRDGRDRDASSP